MRKTISQVAIHNIDEDEGIITGFATTPRLDSTGDIVEPMGPQAAKETFLEAFHRLAA